MNSILNQKKNSAIIIFAKYPELGKVKTRLASKTGEKFAAEFYRICAERIFDEIQELDVDGYLYFPSNDNQRQIKLWAGKNFIYKTQKGKSLGEKMLNAFNEVFNLKYKSAVIIGTDIPEMSSVKIESALKMLNDTQAVIAPSDDGGYSLLGLNQLYPEIFSNIEWSSNTVYSNTVERLESNNIKYFSLPELRDIDTMSDLRKYINNGPETDTKLKIISLMKELDINH